MHTHVGYCGGTTDAPTYRKIGDHAETIQIDFDPQRISYDQLLEIFWTTHNPCRRPWSRQYMSAAFYADDAQREAIERTRKLYVGEAQVVHTEVAPLDRFWIEEYPLAAQLLATNRQHPSTPSRRPCPRNTNHLAPV